MGQRLTHHKPQPVQSSAPATPHADVDGGPARPWFPEEEAALLNRMRNLSFTGQAQQGGELDAAGYVALLAAALLPGGSVLEPEVLHRIATLLVVRLRTAALDEATASAAAQTVVAAVKHFATREPGVAGAPRGG